MKNEMLDLFPDEDPDGTPTETETEDWDLDLSEVLAASEKDEAEKEADMGEGTGAGGETSSAKEDTVSPAAAETFTLNHLGHLQTVERKDVVALAQKGLDYDFVKARLQETREKIKAYEAPSPRKPEPPAVPAESTAPAKAPYFPGPSAPGGQMPPNFTPAAERGFSGKRTGADDADREGEARRKSEVSVIMKYLPGFNGGNVPREVWEEVRRGAPLSSAFLMLENQKLRSELDSARQERRNREKTPGSVSSAGNRNENLDPFLAALSED